MKLRQCCSKNSLLKLFYLKSLIMSQHPRIFGSLSASLSALRHLISYLFSNDNFFYRNASFFLLQPWILSTYTFRHSDYWCTWSHPVTNTQKVRLLWKWDRPEAETSAWLNTTIKRDRHPCPRQDSNPQFQQASRSRPAP